MVKSNRYSPTNKKFKSHFENFASKKVKKGHLNTKDDRDSEDTTIKKGTLVRIERTKMYSDGWLVKIDGKEVRCNYGGNTISIPECTVTETYFVPKKTCEVEVQLDKVSKIYSITKIKDVSLTPIALYDNQLTISTNTNTDTNQNNSAEITISRTSINLSGNVSVSQGIEVEGDVKSTNITTLEKQVSQLKTDGENQSTDINSLTEEIKKLKEQVQTLQGDTNNAG